MFINRYPRLLLDEHQQHLGDAKWSANQRWIALEEPAPLAYTFLTTPINETDGDIDPSAIVPHSGRRTLLHVALDHPNINSYTYQPDGISATTELGTWSLTLPWGAYGALFEWFPNDQLSNQTLTCQIASAYRCGRQQTPTEPVTIQAFLNTDHYAEERVLIQDEAYSLVVHSDVDTTVTPAGLTLKLPANQHKRIAISFNLNPTSALAEAGQLFHNPDTLLNQSAEHWQSYLHSCPRAELALARQTAFSASEIERRQLWHWWVALANVVDLPWSSWSPYLTPDRAMWFGSWSNDTPEALCALTLTNQQALARACILQYLRAAFTPEGDQAWYTHGYGRASLAHPLDSGKLSHGVPAIVHTVEFYIRHSADTSLLYEPVAANLNVWELLQRYLHRLFRVRDPNGDGLLEWVNLWETGWDDKVSPFFKTASIDLWMTTITHGDETQIQQWYQQHGHPTTTIGENNHLLTALASMQRLAALVENTALVEQYATQYRHIQQVLEERHWQPQTTFYQDWDLQPAQLFDAQNLDGFYILYHLENQERAALMVQHLTDPQCFGLRYPPTLSANHPQFKPTSYWQGSYWPREMLYLALALHRHGYRQLALRIVLDALCSQPGCSVAEHLNPHTGARLSESHAMAYSACLNIALLEITTNRPWW